MVEFQEVVENDSNVEVFRRKLAGQGDLQESNSNLANGTRRSSYRLRHTFGSTPRPVSEAIHFPTRRASMDVFVPIDADVGACEETIRRALLAHPTSNVVDNEEGENFVDTILRKPKTVKGSTYKVRLIPVGSTYEEENGMSKNVDDDIPSDDIPMNDPWKEFQSKKVTWAEKEDYLDDEYYKSSNLAKRTRSHSDGLNKMDRRLIKLRPPNDTYPKITEEMLLNNDNFITRPIENQTLMHLNKSVIKGELSTLRGSEWLTDSVIDYYLAMVANRANTVGRPHRRTFFFGCTFYRMLSNAGGLQTVELAADDVDLFSYDLLMFPALANHHWRLIVADVQEKTITAYNSNVYFADKAIQNNIERFLLNEQIRIARVNPERARAQNLSALEWTKVERDNMTIEVPQQNNGVDCGVFVLLFARYLAEGRNHFDFRQIHIPYFRERILYESITKALL